MGIIKRLFLTLIFFLFCSTSWATTYYLRTSASGSSWTTLGNWSTVSPSSSTNTDHYPGYSSADIAYLESNSGSIAVANETFATLNMTGYGSGTGTINWAGQVMTITNGATLEGSMAANSSSSAFLMVQGGGVTLSAASTGSHFPQIEFTTASQTFTFGTSGSGFTWPGNLILDYAGIIYISNSSNPCTIGGVLTFSTTTNLDWTNSSAETLTAQNGLTTNAENGTSPTVSLIITGGTISGAGQVNNNLTITPSTSNITITNLSYDNGTLIYTPSTYSIVGSPVLAIDGGCTLNVSGITWLNVSSHSAIITLLSPLNVLNTFSILQSSSVTFSGAYNNSIGILDLNSTTANEFLSLTAGTTLTITSSIEVQAPSDAKITFTIKSGTPSSTAFINYTGSVANEIISGVTFTDIIATAPPIPFYGPSLINYNGGTLTRTQGIVNVNATNVFHRPINYSTGM